MTAKSLTGGCLCQKITYRVDLPAGAPAPQIAICHCTTCKRGTGSAFSSNLVVPQSTFTYTRGTPKIYTDTSRDEGDRVPKHFCEDCGTPLNWRPNGKGIVAVKTGTLDDESRGELSLGLEICCKRRESWMDQLGQVVQKEGML